jgi:hypothetical protein
MFDFGLSCFFSLFYPPDMGATTPIPNEPENDVHNDEENKAKNRRQEEEHELLCGSPGVGKCKYKGSRCEQGKRMPGGLSSIPTMTEAIADKPQTARRISVLILLRDVEIASIMTISFFDSGFRLWTPNGLRAAAQPWTQLGSRKN